MFCVRYEKENGETEFIATREYFPARLKASIRQKSRWTLGIAFQGLENFSWAGTRVDRYFMWRDRRGPWNSILVVLSTVLFLTFVMLRGFDHVPTILQNSFFQALVILNMFNLIVRMGQRMKAVALTNSSRQSFLVPARWLVANFVNIAATWQAYRQYRVSQKTGQRPVWLKTEHRLPENFGREIEVQAP